MEWSDFIYFGIFIIFRFNLKEKYHVRVVVRYEVRDGDSTNAIVNDR